MATSPAQSVPPTTKERRFERWLAVLSEHIRFQQGEADSQDCRLVYEDAFLGERLVLALTVEKKHCELQVHRKPKGAVMILLAGSALQARSLAELVDGAHRSVARRHNAKRKFLHRVQFMASQLAETFELREKHYPQQALQQFRVWMQDTEGLVGLEARYRTRDGEAEEPEGWLDWLHGQERKLQRSFKRYPTHYAATIQVRGKTRAALFAGGSFSLAGKPITQKVAQQARSHKDTTHTSDEVLEVATEVGELGLEFALDTAVETVGYTAVEAVGAVGQAASGDCGGIDFPDFGGCDAPDCGGCDCSL